MTYQTTLTRKGQVVIPKKIRDVLQLKVQQRLTFELDAQAGVVILRPHADIVDMAGTYIPKKVVSALSARKAFEKRYAQE